MRRVAGRTTATRLIDNGKVRTAAISASSAAAIGRNETGISLVRNATVISYGAQADGIVTIARRTGDAAASDQVLVAFTKDNYTLERSLEWETLGMRGTCSAGFELKARGAGRADFPRVL